VHSASELPCIWQDHNKIFPVKGNASEAFESPFSKKKKALG